MWTRLITRLVLGVLASAALHAWPRECRAQLAATPWPMFQHDPHHTGRTSTVGPSTANIKWIFQAPDAIRNSPSVGTNGDIYVSGGHMICALKPADGTPDWCSDIHNPVGRSSITVGNGALYVGGRDNRLHALDSGGNPEWKYRVGADGDVNNDPVIGTDGTIYFGGYVHVVALNPDGSLKWLVPTESPVFTASLAIADDGTIYAGSLRGTLHAVRDDGPQGTLLWAIPVGRYMRLSAPAIADDGTIYAGTSDGLTAVNPDGTIRWSFPTPGRVTTSPAIASDGTIYFGVKVQGARPILGAWYAITKDGAQVWSYTTTDWMQGSAVIGGDGTVYASAGSEVIAFTPSGDVLWRYATGKRIVAAPAIGGDGTLYVPSKDSKLYAFAP